jgi:hypothetical protein
MMLLSEEDVLGGVEISTGTSYKQTFTQIFHVTKMKSFVASVRVRVCVCERERESTDGVCIGEWIY